MIKAFFIRAGKKLRQLTSKRLPAALPVLTQEDQAAQAAAPAPKKRRRQQRPARSKAPAWTPAAFQVEAKEGQSRFHDFSLPDSLLHGIADLNFRYCTAIQAAALPPILAGQDIMAKAATGTGKSAAFLIGIFSQLLKQRVEGKAGQPQALILAPTRELVLQIAQEGHALARHSPLRILAIYGGTDYQKQEQAVNAAPVDVLVATPGRLLDYVSRKSIQLHQVQILVFDEADRMLDMGFIPDVRRIVGKIRAKDQRQTLLFSATLTEEVKSLAAQWCVQPLSVESNPEQVTVDTVSQVVYTATSEEKYTILYHLLSGEAHQRIIVFTNMKSEAARLHERLERHGIAAVLMTGDVPQNKRMSRLERFRKDPKGILIATDVAGRGIHINGISHVINYSLPNEPEDYVHRIGRTGRAGESGIAISFACEEGAFALPDIEAYIGQPLACIQPPEALLQALPPLQARKKKDKAGLGSHRTHSSRNSSLR